MASHEYREPLTWAACVLGLAALFLIIGILTPRRPMAPSHAAPAAQPGDPATPLDS